MVFIYIPDGFPGAGEIARLNKAACGTKQGARRFYDYTAKMFTHIGLIQCPNDPCLYRYLYRDTVCFVIQYVDDALLAGENIALDHLRTTRNLSNITAFSAQLYYATRFMRANLVL